MAETNVPTRIVRQLAPLPQLRVQRMPGAVLQSTALPERPNTVVGDDPWGLWLGPSEWLLYGGADVAALARSVATDIEAGRCVVTDVSHAALILELDDSDAVELLATGCGLDLAGGAVAPGACAQSHFQQIPILLHRPQGMPGWRLFVDRSLGRYLADSLCSRHEVRHLRPR